MTYSELLDRSRKIAGVLHRYPSLSRIGICSNDVTELVISMTGIMLARCVFVPLDPTLPEERLSMIIRESGLSAILAMPGIFPASEEIPMIMLPLVSEQVVAAGPTVLPEYREDDPLYIYFTSGSTGMPKGIVGRNGSLWHFLKWETELFGIGEGNRFSQLISPYFDAFLRDIFVPLMSGGTICVPPKVGGLPDAERLKRWVDEQEISFVHCVPSVFRLLNDGRLEERDFGKLRYVLMSGERVIPADLIDWYKCYGSRIQLVNLYGATEATMISSCYLIQKEDAQKDKISIGKPIADAGLLVLDEDLQPCDPFSVGELYIVSDYLSLGYLNNPLLTTERFIQLEVEGLPGRPAYKTGDKARVLLDGSIDLLGREDRMVKIRGVRIELDEIESVLAKCSLVASAVVLHDKSVESLTAFCTGVTGIGREAAVGEIEGFLKARLPRYMIPARIVVIDAMPLLSNGKVDLKKLMSLSEQTEFIGPEGETEQKLHAIWEDILHAGRISVVAKFNQVGGDSLKMMKLMPRIYSEFGVRITLAELFQHLTIRDQAALIERAGRATLPTGIPKAPGRPYYELTSAQKRLFFLNEFDPSSLAYNMPQVIELEGELRADMLEDAMRKLVDRHESLRTSFAIIDGKVVQQIAREVSIGIEYFEAEGENSGEVIEAFIRPFDLGKAPLLRMGLAKMSNRRHLLLVDMHHIVADGISQSLLVKEFMALYNGQELPEQYLQYKDFAEWQRGSEQQEQIQAQREFWMQEFSEEVKVLDLPADLTRPAMKSYKGRNLPFTLSQEETQKLKSLGERTDATMFMTVLSLFNILLWKLSGQEDITIGTVVAGRDYFGLENVIGMFANTLPLRNFPKGSLRFDNFLREIKANSLLSFDNQSYPYEELISDLNVVRDISRNPLFDVLFVFENFHREELRIPGLKVKSYSFDYTMSKFDLTLTAVESGGALHLNFQYATDLFSAATIANFIACFRRIVTAVISDATVKLSGIDILSEEERQKIIYGFNDTRADLPRDKTIIDLFREQVRKTPGEIALIGQGVKMTYGELDAASDALAAYLGRSGVRKADIVGLMCDRRTELVTGMLGILKAGATYLPMDPTFPGNRIDDILEDSGARSVLLQSKYKDRINRDITVIAFPGMEDLLSEEVEMQAPEGVGDLAYVIYTSGSTGKPKGVMIAHRAVTNFSIAMDRLLHFRDKVILSVTNYTFDIFVLESLVPLLYGGTVVLATEEELRDPATIYGAVSKHGVNMIQATPALLRMIVEPALSLQGLKNITHILSAGEAIPLSLMKSLQGVTRARIFNMYGPTETTVYSTVQELTHAQRVTIGKPIDNTCIYILNKDLQVQPVGVAGELCIAGEGLARGYLNKKQLTSEKFIENPFSPGESLYRTGDTARWLPDGTIEYIGRSDGQVKVRGIRIDLGDIESHLATCPGVKGAVAAVKKRGEDKYLVAYYVADGDIPQEVLRKHLSAYLPHYMVPANYIRLERIPLTYSGKINRGALPEPDFSAGHDYVAPSGDTEEKLAAIWSDLLRIDRKNLAANRSFFDLGGDSISIVLLKNKVNAQFNVAFSVADVFNMPTVSSMAGMIDRSGHENRGIAGLNEEAELRENTLALLGIE